MADTQFTVKVVNHLTGEISEIEIKGPDTAKNAYVELQASLSALNKAKKQLTDYLDIWLGEDQEHVFPDGKRLRRVQRESKQWTFEGLKLAGFDEDTIAAVSKVDMTMARQVVKEMVERGDVKPGAGKILDEHADITATKPFVELR